MAMETKEIPAAEQAKKPLPKKTPAKEKKPETGIVENKVVIGGETVEIKPTKLKYHRNRTAVFYRMLEVYALPDLLAMDINLGDGRDSDKALMDWLIAVTDDEDLILRHYDEIDSETVEKMMEIFKRVNHIDEKDEKRKNLEVKGQTAN